MSQLENADQHYHEVDRNDDANWRFGIFYFNPADKRLFPPKRLPMFGWTVNFANPRSVMALVLLIAGILLLTYLGNFLWSK